MSAAAGNPPLVFAAMAAAMLDLAQAGIGKDRDNKQQGFKFRGVDDVYNALAPVLAKHQLVIVPTVTHHAQTERTTRNGGTLIYTTLCAQYTVYCGVDGSSFTGSAYGEAMDSADKSTNKAMSAAFKYFAFQAFCIPTEGMEDADAVTPPASTPKPAAKEQPPVPPSRSSSPENPGHDADWETDKKAFFAQLAEIYPFGYNDLCDFLDWMYNHGRGGSGDRPSAMTRNSRKKLLAALKTEKMQALHQEFLTWQADKATQTEGEGA